LSWKMLKKSKRRIWNSEQRFRNKNNNVNKAEAKKLRRRVFYEKENH
jgi:hypothetical protein